MPDQELLLSTISDIVAQTREMLAAAQDSNWDRLIELERRRLVHFSTWAKIAQDGGMPPPASREALLALQAMDIEIQQLAAVRFAALKEELALTTTRQKLLRHYHG